MKRIALPLLLLLPFVCTSCFSPADEPISGVESPDAVRVTFSVSAIEQISFDGTDTRASLASLCSRITLSAFSGGEKVKNVNQQSDDTGFGTFDVSLSPGTYQIVIIAHSGSGNCTVTSPDKITFANNKCTDTFYYYGTIDVTEPVNRNVELSRCVAMFRLQTTDPIPDDVSQMQFYYTGGSSTFSAVSGFGCVNSRQTETFTISTSQQGQPGRFEVYTFPHDVSGDLKMTVTAFNAAQQKVTEREFNPLHVTINRVTSCTTAFFSSSDPSTSSEGLCLSIANDGEWEGIDEID